MRVIVTPAMRVAALSDLHIGVTEARDGFRHDPSRFGAFLDQLEAEHDRIVLLGDIFQTDHGAIPTRASARRHLRRAQARLRPLADRLRGPKYVYVFGNHDAIAGAELGASEHVCLEDHGVRILFIHGHQFDPVAVRAPFAADLGTWFTGRLRAIGLRPAAAWLEGRDIAIKDRRFRGPEGPYARGASALAITYDARVVVMGHTHCGRIDDRARRRLVDDAEDRPVLVANTGSCSRGALSWISVDTAMRRLRLLTGDAVRSAEF
jgi:UDP-2,3-diacylglucosamine pyrophosphatase LpxH